MIYRKNQAKQFILNLDKVKPKRWIPLRVLFIHNPPRNMTSLATTKWYRTLLKWIGELELDLRYVRLVSSEDATALLCYVEGVQKIVFIGKKAKTNCRKINDPILLSKNANPVDAAIVAMNYNLEFNLFRGGDVPKHVYPIPFTVIDNLTSKKFINLNYKKHVIKKLKRWLYYG